MSKSELILAAQALIARWDCPAWKEQEHTGHYINRLRIAVDAALTQQEAEPVAERFNECVHGVTFNSECEQCSAECAAGLPPQSQKVKIDMGAAVMDRLIHVGYTNPLQIAYGKEEKGAFFPDTENDCVIPLYMLKVHTHRLGYPVAESSPPKPAALPQPVASVPQDAEQFANDVAEWSQTQFEDVIRVSHFREFMRQRDAGYARVPVARIESVVRDVDYLRETPRRTQPFVRINFTHEDYDSRDTVCAVLASASQEGV